MKWKTYMFNVEVLAINPKAPDYDKDWEEIESFTEDVEDDEFPYDAEKAALEYMAECLEDDYKQGISGWYAYRIHRYEKIGD